MTIRSRFYSVLFGILILASGGCNNQPPDSENQETMDWKAQFKEILSEFGHRNWVLVVDKAFPSQNSEGIITIHTGEDLFGVLSHTLKEVDQATHVKPIVYTDKELNFITSEMVSQIDEYRGRLDEMLRPYDPLVMLHDSVFVKIDKASKLFRVLVLKTEEVIAYSSVFIELDCKYWSGENENALREAMMNYPN
jgi:hypothetical protein